MIIGLENEAEIWTKKKEDIAGIVRSYFHDLFVSFNPSNIESALHELQLGLGWMNMDLIAYATKEEVRLALLLMHQKNARSISYDIPFLSEIMASHKNRLGQYGEWFSTSWNFWWTIKYD